MRKFRTDRTLYIFDRRELISLISPKSELCPLTISLPLSSTITQPPLDLVRNWFPSGAIIIRLLLYMVVNRGSLASDFLKFLISICCHSGSYDMLSRNWFVMGG